MYHDLGDATLAKAKHVKALGDVEGRIDHLAAELWGITEAELTEIKRSLAEVS